MKVFGDNFVDDEEDELVRRRFDRSRKPIDEKWKKEAEFAQKVRSRNEQYLILRDDV